MEEGKLKLLRSLSFYCVIIHMHARAASALRKERQTRPCYKKSRPIKFEIFDTSSDVLLRGKAGCAQVRRDAIIATRAGE